MTDSSLRDIVERARFASPAPRPQAIAHDGSTLYVSSWETRRLYGIDPADGRAYEDWETPGNPTGGTFASPSLRFVLSETDDSRFIRAFTPDDGFATDALACPGDTGSFLAYDGASLWLSQRHDKRVLALDANADATRTIDVGEQIVGFAFVAGRFALALWLGKERGGAAFGWLDPSAARPELRLVARAPFVAVGLAYDGVAFWTNDHFAHATVSFSLPQVADA